MIYGLEGDSKLCKSQSRHLQSLGCLKCDVFSGCCPDFWNDILNLTIGHGWQACQRIAQVSVGFYTVVGDEFVTPDWRISGCGLADVIGARL